MFDTFREHLRNTLEFAEYLTNMQAFFDLLLLFVICSLEVGWLARFRLDSRKGQCVFLASSFCHFIILSLVSVFFIISAQIVHSKIVVHSKSTSGNSFMIFSNQSVITKNR